MKSKKKSTRKGTQAYRKSKFENISHSMEQRLLQIRALDAEVRSGKRYVLEAKVAPQEWQRADRIYPDITHLKSYYHDREYAHEAKTYIKWFLKSNRTDHPPKLPLRIRAYEWGLAEK